MLQSLDEFQDEYFNVRLAFFVQPSPFSIWKYRRAAIDPMDFGRTKVDPLEVGELLSILQCIGELRSILCVLGELRSIPLR